MKSQIATATIDSASVCAADTILVPIDVTDFIDVGAMTIFIGYDTNSAEFISLANINPAIPGAMTVNDNNGQVGIAYSYIVGFTIANGKLFDLRYLLNGDSTELTFNPGTEIANINLEVIPLETTDGGIFNAVNIIEQPDSVQAYPDTDVNFTLLASGNNLAYQWEENTGSGWESLQNNTTYSGVDADSLTISDISLGFNGYQYRCLVIAGNCEIHSDSALLEVANTYPAATIAQVSSCPELSILDPIFVGDFFDVVEFTFNISYSHEVLEFVDLQNIHPDLLPGILTTQPLTNPNGISIHWEHNDPVSITSGKLFDMEFNYSALSTAVTFIDGSEVYNSLSNQINITLSNGSVSQEELPIVLSQPASQTIQLNDQAIFTVEATGVEAYQWQVSSDEGQSWMDLTNTIPYYNVTTETLTIDPVTWDLEGYQYACLLIGEYCTISSDAAVLNVDTLTSAGGQWSQRREWLSISPNPAKDIVTLAYWSKSPCQAEISIYTLTGTIIKILEKETLQRGENSLQVDLQSIEPGFYLVTLKPLNSADKGIRRAKMIKVSN